MKDWWQYLTIDWPCALGDWLWAMLVIEPARLIDKITRRRVLHVIGIILLLMFYEHVVALDLTFLFGVDLGLVVEIAAATFVLVSRDQARNIVKLSQRGLKKIVHTIRRGQVRETVTRVCRKLLPPKDEEGEPAFA